MYKILKIILERTIPKNIRIKYEKTFRYLFYLFYIGNKYKCNVCSRNLRTFKLIDNEKLCPSCGSLSRNRRLWDLLNNTYLKDNLHVLDFSPSRNIYQVLKKRNIKYTASDLSGNFISDVSFDMTKIESPDSKYDLIICYHILEHIIEDEKAMQELHRILKYDGYCIIQTPFKGGDIYEDYSITSKPERIKHFGQDDHVRIYSVAGLSNRLEKNGFKVNPLNFKEDDVNLHGFSTTENILVCTK